MQTFLPFPDFEQSANIIDKKRCFNQVKEAEQILRALSCRSTGMIYTTSEDKGQHTVRGKFYTDDPNQADLDARGNPKRVGWIYHPATLMWEGYQPALMDYFNHFLRVSKEKFKVDTNYEFFDVPEYDDYPWWFGNEKFHRSMRSRLIEKNRDHYLPLFPGDEAYNGGLYLWPLSEDIGKFRMIIRNRKTEIKVINYHIDGDQLDTAIAMKKLTYRKYVIKLNSDPSIQCIAYKKSDNYWYIMEDL